MPSARALLVASLLTEPPYGCLGPSGNDRYRKRSLHSQTVGASQVNCQVAAALRNESITSRRVRAGASGGSTAMTRTAFCRKSPRVRRVCWLGSWALGTSDRGGRGGQDKANWRSRTRRSSAIEKPLSAHWFLEALRPAPDDVLTRYGWLLSSFPKKSNAPRDGARGLRFEPLRILFRSRARDCDFMRSTHGGSCAGPVR